MVRYMIKKNTKNTSLRKQAHRKLDTIFDTAQGVQDKKNEAVNTMYKKASQRRNNINAYIQKNPKKSVLIAAGAGAIASSVVIAAMSKKKEAET